LHVWMNLGSLLHMSILEPTSARATHEVVNQPPPFEDVNAFLLDTALREAVERDAAPWLEPVREAGAHFASAEANDACRRAQRNLPVLHTHDRYGHRVDAVEYDSGFHWMLSSMVERGIGTLPWTDPRPGAEVARTALMYLANGLDTAPTCPIAINHGAVAMLRQAPDLAGELEAATVARDYAAYLQWGMVMTEKQGGSDLRANSTRAEPAGDGWWELTGHKWFCTHPVFGSFFTLAQTDAGITCFVADRPHPGFRIARLKDKLGGRSLASSEVEFDRLPARMLGEEGRGTRFMVEQLAWTRFDTMIGIAGIVRRAVTEAIHHARHRHAFGAPLAEKAAMRNVLADLALESEAMLQSSLRIARAYDPGAGEPAFGRVGTTVLKYWVTKRGAPTVAEALECLGGNGYVEEAPLARLYRDVQIGTVWEGAGNVMALDLVRAVHRDPEGIEAFLAECELARGAHPALDRRLDGLPAALDLLRGPAAEWHARAVIEDLALVLQAGLLCRNAPATSADAFCAARLTPEGGAAFGTLPRAADADSILDRALAI
jgi:putative acyl-CoA dehydrogenase